MRKMLTLVSVVILIASFISLGIGNVRAAEEEAISFQAGKKTTLPFYVYKDKLSRDNHYIASGWCGDYRAVRLNDNWKENPYEGKSCIKWTYSGEPTQGAAWAGCFWQNPANNWGRIKGGYDLTGASKLTFWAKGEVGGEIVEFKMGGVIGEYSDTTEVTLGPISLTKEWKQYTIDLSGEDLSYIGGGFCWVTSNLDVPEEGIVFYLDEIIYEE